MPNKGIVDSTMKGVNILSEVNRINGKYELNIPGVGRKYRGIVVRPSVSRGRGYAVVLIREEIDKIENIIIWPAPGTSQLARIGRFDSISAPSSLADLPETVIRRIFSNIDDASAILKCASVCKTWRRVIQSMYVVKPPIGKKSICAQPGLKKLFETTKLKIFGKVKEATGVETASQRKERTMSFREVSIMLDEAGEENIRLLNFLSRMAPFLSNTKAFLLADIELNDALMTFLFDVWQPRAAELRLLKCSFGQLSTTIIRKIFRNKRFKHLYIDNCPITSECSLVSTPILIDLCTGLTRLELCFSDTNGVTSSIINDDFVISIASTWKTKNDIHWLKFSNAPKITTDGVEKLLQIYFKLRYGSRRHDDRKDFMKPPNLVLWLRGSSFDPNEFLKRRWARRYFRDDKLPTQKRQKLRDTYGGEDVVIWVEKD